MKYALMVNIATENIGDDIQSLAALRFLPQVDYIVDRERLDLFFPETAADEPVSVIMNGWYMYNKYNWPPSPYLLPLLTSIHFSEQDNFKIGDKFLEGLGGEYLRHNGPVGARDSSTLALLERNQIPCYLSGCLTLTLEKYEGVCPSGNVILVDLEAEQEALLRERYPSCCFEAVSHWVDYHISEQTASDWDARRSRAEELLKKYQGAACVVTSRLHCALPCLALGVPVLVLYREEYASRMESFLPLLHHCTWEELRDGKALFDLADPAPNGTEYMEIREALIRRCEAFIQQPKAALEPLPVASLFRSYWLEKATWQKNLLVESEKGVRVEIEKQHKWINELERTKEFFQQQTEQRDKRIDELTQWTKALGEGKEYLEEQVGQRSRRIEELEDWITQLERTRDYLKSQNEQKDARISELEGWTAQLEETRDYLSGQSEQKDARIAELDAWNAQLVSGKDYLESQLSRECELSKKLQQEKSLLSQELSKLNFKLNLLLNDAKVQKIIKKKHYEI